MNNPFVNKKMLFLLMVLLSLLAVIIIVIGVPGQENNDAVQEQDLISGPISSNDPQLKRENRQQAQTLWLKEHARPIKSLQFDGDTYDLQFLKPLLKDKEIILIGESNHISSEFNQLKARLIRFLHQEMGFEVLAFESGMGEIFTAYHDAGDLNPEELQMNTLYGVWHAEELRSLFTYIDEQAQSHRPLILSGFDIQPASTFFGTFLKRWISPLDSELAQQAFEWESFISTSFDNKEREKIDPRKEELVSGYQKILAFIEENEDQLKEYAPHPDTIVVVKRVLKNRIDMLQQSYVVKNLKNQFQMRDRMMADNLLWLVHELYPDKKIIVWAHNFHIRKNNANSSMYMPMMGDFLQESLRRSSYTIGLHFYQGMIKNENEEFVQVEGARFEEILSQSDDPVYFLDWEQAEKEPGNEWIFERQNSYQVGPDQFVPAEQYDGILFIDRVNPANFFKK